MKPWIEYQKDENGEFLKDENDKLVISFIEHYGAYDKQETYKAINTLVCSGSITGFEEGKTKDFELKDLSSNLSYDIYWKVVVNGVAACVKEGRF